MDTKCIPILLCFSLCLSLQLKLVTSSALPWQRSEGVHLRDCTTSNELLPARPNIRNRTGLKIARSVSGDNFAGWLKFEYASDSKNSFALALERPGGKLFFVNVQARRPHLILFEGSTATQSAASTDRRFFQYRNRNTNSANSHISQPVLYHVATGKYVGQHLKLVNDINQALQWCLQLS